MMIESCRVACLPSTDFYLHGNSDDSVFCHSIVWFKILHRWCQFESISSHGIKHKFCMMILWCFPMFSRTLQSVPFEHYYKWPSILLLPCTWQPDASSLAGPFPSRSQDLGGKRHSATIGDGMARSFLYLLWIMYMLWILPQNEWKCGVSQ